MCAVTLCGLMVMALALGGCAHLRTQAPAYSATATANMKATLPPDQARREAVARAEVQARDQILLQAGQMRLNDGRTLEDVAIVDPYVRAVLQDTVRAAQVANRTVSSDGQITVTMRLEQKPLQQLIQSYQAQHPAAK